VRARGISKRYPGGVFALETVDLTIHGGDRFVLLGPNGAGKSTLVRILSSLSRSDEGEYAVCGLDPHRETRELMRAIGVVTQDNDLDPQASAAELLRFQGRLFGMNRIDSAARAGELIDALDLGDHAHKRVDTLSGGNRRKLHCALALVHRPRLLFLDEPTVGMDPEVRARFWESIRRVNREEGTTLFLTTQYLEEAERHADQLALLRNGRIAYRGTVESFVRESRRLATSPIARASHGADAGHGTDTGHNTDAAHRTSLEEGYLAYLTNVDTVEVTNAAH
jgi:ABC-2 type transport system ATP-binding protein